MSEVPTPNRMHLLAIIVEPGAESPATKTVSRELTAGELSGLVLLRDTGLWGQDIVEVAQRLIDLGLERELGPARVQPLRIPRLGP